MSCCCVLRNFILVNANASVLWIFWKIRHVWISSRPYLGVPLKWKCWDLLHLFFHTAYAYFSTLFHTAYAYLGVAQRWKYWLGCQSHRDGVSSEYTHLKYTHIHTYLFSHTYIHIQYTHPHIYMIWDVYMYYIYTSHIYIHTYFHTHTFTYTHLTSNLWDREGSGWIGLVVDFSKDKQGGRHGR